MTDNDKEKNKGEMPVGIAISKLHSLRRIALRPKFLQLYKIGRQKGKTVIFCSYVDEAMQIAEDLSEEFKVGYIDGTISAKERERIMTSIKTPLSLKGVFEIKEHYLPHPKHGWSGWSSIHDELVA